MKLKAIYKTKEEIPEQYVDLFTEKNGQWELTGVEGVKSQADFDRSAEALKKERNDHKETKEHLRSVLGDRTVEETIALLDKVPELEAAAGNADGKKIDELVEARIKGRLAPIERERDKLKKENETLSGEVNNYKTEKKNRAISDAVRKAATEAKMLPEAIDDALLYGERLFDVDDSGNVVSKDSVGVTPGVSPSVWLSEIQEKRPHWWGPTQGAGSRGGSGAGSATTNPWTHEGWNMTEQGRILAENRQKAEQLAKSAGTTIGGPRPSPKK